jgi:uncharacterized protein (DUF885 family)
MKALIVWLGMAAIAAAPLSARAGDKDFEKVANAYVEDLLKSNPEAATLLGDHRYDDRLDDLSPQADEQFDAALKALRADIEKLSSDNLKGDDALTRNLLLRTRTV